MALSRLPEPHDPPANQVELLAATMQPVVAFVVLGSILIRKYYKALCGSPLKLHDLSDGLSIPAFWFGRKGVRTMSMSATWSRTLTIRNRDPPDWVLWARRAPSTPGELAPSETPPDLDVERGTQHVNPEDALAKESRARDEQSDAISGKFATAKEGGSTGLTGEVQEVRIMHCNTI